MRTVRLRIRRGITSSNGAIPIDRCDWPLYAIVITGRSSLHRDGVVVSARTADGARPRQKTQHRMRSDTKEKEHKRLDHRARSAPERRSQRKRSAYLFIEAGRPQHSHSHTLSRSKTRTRALRKRRSWGNRSPEGHGPGTGASGYPCHGPSETLLLEEISGPQNFGSAWTCKSL